MLPIQQKLHSKSGASMIMAMVFLLFCLLIGGSVHATATANGSRIERMVKDQQEYYSQRSAMRLMSDMLIGKDGEELQVVVTDVTVKKDSAEAGVVTGKTISISSSSLPDNVPYLQKILMEVVLDSYRQEGVNLKYSDFSWITDPNPSLSSASGDIYMACDTDPEEALVPSDHLVVHYKIDTPNAEGSKDYSLELDFGADQSHFVLTMDGTVSPGTPKTVTVGDVETTTTTTVIRWSLPDIQKGQYADENQNGGNEE